MAHEFNFEVIPLTDDVIHPYVAEEDNEPVVLVVDDEPLIVDSLSAILKTTGLRVLKAYSGEDALETAMLTPPTLLLTDVAMPGMNGIDLAMMVADALPACKVLLFSAHASSLDLSKARASGYDFPLMAKPTHPVQMIQRVFETLRGCGHGTPYRPERVLEPNKPPMWMLPEIG